MKTRIHNARNFLRPGPTAGMAAGHRTVGFSLCPRKSAAPTARRLKPSVPWEPCPDPVTLRRSPSGHYRTVGFSRCPRKSAVPHTTAEADGAIGVAVLSKVAARPLVGSAWSCGARPAVWRGDGGVFAESRRRRGAEQALAPTLRGDQNRLRRIGAGPGEATAEAAAPSPTIFHHPS